MISSLFPARPKVIRGGEKKVKINDMALTKLIWLHSINGGRGGPAFRVEPPSGTRSSPLLRSHREWREHFCFWAVVSFTFFTEPIFQSSFKKKKPSFSSTLLIRVMSVASFSSIDDVAVPYVPNALCNISWGTVPFPLCRRVGSVKWKKTPTPNVAVK